MCKLIVKQLERKVIMKKNGHTVTKVSGAHIFNLVKYNPVKFAQH